MKNKQNYYLHIIALILTYLAFAFVQAKINPFTWEMGTRAFMLIVNGGAQLVVFLYRIENE